MATDTNNKRKSTVIPVEDIERGQDKDNDLELVTNDDLQLDTADLIAQQSSALNQEKEQLEGLTDEQAELEKQVVQSMVGITNQGADVARLQQREGLPQLQEQLSRINAEISAEEFRQPARLLQAEQDVIGTGVSTSMLGRRLSNRQRDNAIRNLMLSAESAKVRGDVELAQQRIETAVNAKYEPIKQLLDIQKFQLERLDEKVKNGQVSLDKKRKNKLELQLNQIEQEQEKAERLREFTTNIAKNGAPVSVIEQASNANSILEILKIPNALDYMISKGDKLDNALKSEKIQQIRDERKKALKAMESGELTEEQYDIATKLRKEYNGLDQVKNASDSVGDTRTILRALNDDTGTSDIAAINSFQRIAVDPGVAVREGDVALLRSALSFGDKAYLKSQGLLKGNKLTEKARKDMRSLIKEIHNSRIATAEEQAEPIKKTAVGQGIDYNEYIAADFKTSEELIRELELETQEGIERTESGFVKTMDADGNKKVRLQGVEREDLEADNVKELLEDL